MNNQLFNSDNHSLELSDDGSYTAYSKEYKEHYHSTKDGAFRESLSKHIEPAMSIFQDKKELFILDICYGLGFNTLATLYYIQQKKLDIKVSIYSPELDKDLVKSLENFIYPKEFQPFLHIVKQLSQKGFYEDENIFIEVFLGDAREYVKGFRNKFDIVYQDAFSPNVNPLLWTEEYFKDISNAIKENGIVTTYSTALRTRLALYNNSFFIYLNEGENFRDATIASKKELQHYKKVDMLHKIACNPTVQPLKDIELT